MWLICMGDLRKRSFRTSINVPPFCCVNRRAPSRGQSKEPRVGIQPQGKRLLTPANLPPPVLTRGAVNRTKSPKTALEGKGISPPARTIGAGFSEGKDSCSYNSDFWNKEVPWRKPDCSYKHLCPSRENSSPLCQAVSPLSKASSVSGRHNRSLKGLYGEA